MVLSFQPHSVSGDGDGRLGPIVPDGDFEQCEEEPPVAMTDSKGWSYELPKTEESPRHMELTDGDEGEEEKLVQDNRLRILFPLDLHAPFSVGFLGRAFPLLLRLHQ